MTERNKKFDEKKEILRNFLKILKERRIPMTLNYNVIGTLEWYRVDVSARNISIELTAPNKIVNGAENGLFKAWHGDLVSQVNDLEDLTRLI